MMVSEVGTVARARLPIAVFSEHLRLGRGFAQDPREDALLEHYLRAALATIRIRTGKALIAGEYSWQVSRWQSPRRQAMPLGPVQAVSGLHLIRANGEIVDVDMPLAVAGDALVGDLPRIPAGGMAAFTFRAGFGEWADIPADLRQAVLVLATQYYEDRGGEMTVAVPPAVEALIAPWRQRRLGGAA